MTLWRAAEPLVLASKSAVRRAVLEAAGVPVEVDVADIDERGIEARSGLTDPGEVAKLLAREKARAVSARTPGRIVLGADQTLALGERRFSKAADRAGAREQLRALRGKTHALHSAVAVLRDGMVLYEHVATARLTMRDVLRCVPRALSRRGRRRRHGERRRLSARGPRRAIVRARRRRSFHRARPAAAAAVAMAARRAACLRA